jgi:glycogen debranching enzyme
MEKLKRIAYRTLESNILYSGQLPYLAAGGHQFGSLWTRDFCFAARGLIISGRADVVRNHLTHLISTRRSDGLIARILESVPSMKRVLLFTVFRFLPMKIKTALLQPDPIQPLRAEHVGEHGTVSIDSNALVLRVAADLHRLAPDEAWLRENKQGLQNVLEFCLRRTENGQKLVHQGAFEDWQDSASRTGETFYVNLMFALAFRSAESLGLSLPASVNGFSKLVENRFFDKKCGMFLSHSALNVISLDGNSLAISEDFAPHLSETIYAALKASELWCRAEIPGVATFPNYPASWISWTTKAVGLRHYHDQIFWSWLAASAVKACLHMNDPEEATRIITKLEEMAVRDDGIAEIYKGTKDLPMFKSPLYVSEKPFSWGAGMIIEALDSTRLHSSELK